ncbi:uncharacterized protein LOC117640919 isoform X2 [Thrips palmi]|uniref:Uncharacterized protein LOC117640919 isoform X2 n=1 Tax=Thrips palmi TaxID=161013 RepID=A0A6P8YIU3_THRPL|nr:uncharacterized protein LOC117640919 isoform X2 [Thrips palmi]
MQMGRLFAFVSSSTRSSMAWTALPLLLLACTSWTASADSSPTIPLSYVLADTAFLADEISSKDGLAGADGMSRVLEYLHHVERTVGGIAAPFDGHPRSRRQLPTDPLTTLTEDHQGVFLLKKLVPTFNIPAKFPNDVVLFSRMEAGEEAWYAAALEADGENPQLSLANSLVLYKLMGTRFLEQDRKVTFGGSTLSVQQIDGWTYLVAAERTSHLRAAPENGPILYRLSLDGKKLITVMTLQTHNPSDVFFWQFMNSHYLAVASEFTNTTQGLSFAADTLVYKWYGEHLDIVQRLRTSGAKAVTSFTIDSNQYLVVVNHANDAGETSLQSTVYRFDVVTGAFVVHQHLRTHAAVDASFFTMRHARGQDHFLAVANEYYQGLDQTKNYETSSVIYKWSDGFFVPFQSLRLVGASRWASYSGPHDEMVLLGTSTHGLHGFQYDGWRFRQLTFPGDMFGSGADISSLRTTVYGSKGLVVVARKQNAGVHANVFELQFEKSMQLDQLQEELSFWCNKELGELARRSAAQMLERVNAAPKWSDDVVEVNSIVFESNSTINTLATGSIKSKSQVIDPAFVEDLNSLAGELELSREKLNEAQAIMDQALKLDRHNTVRGTVVLHNASVSCVGPCRFGHADVRLLNNENAVSLVKNMIRLDADVSTEGALRFSSVVVPGDLKTSKVLGEAAPLVSKVHTRHLLGSLVVNELVVDAGLNVDGTIDGVHISPETVLLVDGDQTLKGIDSVTHWQVDKLVLHGKVNGMTVDVSRPELPPEAQPSTTPVSLSVRDVSLGGLLGGVDIVDVAQRALRTRGTQQVTGLHSFAKLSVQDALSRGLNMNAIARTDVHLDKLPGPLRFTQPLVADKVQVYKRLNHIAVAADGSMDLLLNKAGGGATQHVVAPKWLRRLRVTDLGRIYGRILGLVLPAEDEPLVRVVQDDILVEGDVSIAGRVDVQGTVTAPNIVEPSSGVTVLNVLQDAVRINAPLPPNVLVEDLEVSNVEVTMVNGVPTNVWILDAPGQEVRLTKMAKFTEGVTVTGSSTLTGTVNGVDLRLLDETALKTTGDQVIYGHKTFPSITANGVWSNDTLLGGARWLDLWARRISRQGHNGVVKLEDDVSVDGELILKRLTLDGTLGGVNISATLQDSVFQDSSVTVIDGPKTFRQTVSVDNLHVEPTATGSDLGGVFAATVPGGVAQPDGHSFAFPSLAINRPLSVAKLRYRGTLDGVSDAEWAVPWLEVEGDQTLYGPQTVLGDVEVMGSVTANSVNNLDLKTFAQQVARIDDPTLRLGTVTFDGPVVANGSVTAGSVRGVNLADALLARGVREQEMRGRVVLAGGLEAQGVFDVAGTLAGEDFKALCRFASPAASQLNVPQHLDVKGDLLLNEEPVLGKSINGQDMRKLLNNTWLRDRGAKITARMEFGDVQFTNDVNVKRHIDGVNLEAVAQRYVSLTKDETISTSIRVTKDIKVERKIVTDVVDVGGLVGGIRLADFPKLVLMDGPDQDVLARMKFGIVETTGGLSLDGTINGLDLSRDVVLIKDNAAASLDHNVVQGSKVVQGNVYVTDLALQEDTRVQGVDLAAWNRDAVRVSGDYVITGSKTLHQPQVVGGLNVDGLVAGVRVNASHLLLRHSDQLVTGVKTLVPAPLPGLGLRVQSLEVIGKVNGVNMRELLANQAYKTSDVAVLTPVHLAATAELHSNAAWVDGTYQGINITDMIYAAQHPLTLEQYAAQHEALRRTAEHVQQSLQAQGYYLNYYHTAVSLRVGVSAVLPLGRAPEDSAADPAFAIAIVMEHGVGQSLTVDFFSWDTEQSTIVSHPTLRRRVSLSRTVRLIAPATYAGLNALYWEEEESSGVFVGRVMGILRDGRLGKAEVLRSTLASAWVSMTEVGDMACLIRGSPGAFERRDGFCSMHCLGQGKENLVELPLDAPRPTDAVALTVLGVPHVFVASGASEVSEGEVNVWRWEGSTLRLSQNIGVVNASSLAVTEYRGVHYLATASGHVADSPHEGLVHISRFYSDKWVHWMSVEVEGPRSMQFATLPSGQLVLYVATTCPTDSLVVLQYRGVSGFVRRASAAVPMGGVLSAFTTSRHHHLVAVSGSRQAALLQAAFKGNWEASELAARAVARGG